MFQVQIKPILVNSIEDNHRRHKIEQVTHIIDKKAVYLARREIKSGTLDEYYLTNLIKIMRKLN